MSRMPWPLLGMVGLLGGLCGTACGETAEPAPPPTVAERAPATPSSPTSSGNPPATAAAPPSTPQAAPEASASPVARSVAFGDVYELSSSRYAAGQATVLVETEATPRPAGPVIAYAETHHSHWEFREVGALDMTYTTAVLVSSRGTTISLCEATVTRARHLHATSVYEDDDGGETPAPETTFLAFEVEGCREGMLAVLGVPRGEISSRTLDRRSLSEPAPLELVDLVREQDYEAFGERVAAADFRMLSLPRHDITIVSGAIAWVVRDGRVLQERFGGFPTTLIEAGPLVAFTVDSVSESWSSALRCFAPTYDAGSCEVIDESGTPANVRAAPSGRAAVVTTVTRGTTVAADDHVGSWYRLLTTPSGWAHESGLRCTELPRHPAPCP